MSHSSPEAHRLTDASITSSIPEINQRILDVLPRLNQAGIVLEDTRPVPYGCRLVLRNNDRAIGVTIYFSKKKGHSTIIDASAPPDVARRIRSLFNQRSPESMISPDPREQRLTSWIGCDEGGKGAYTGPLVAVAFKADTAVVGTLGEMEVADSKTLPETMLRQVARALETRFGDRLGIVELMPETYNRLYSTFRAEGRSLNHLLAWAHGKAIEKLALGPETTIVIDQFAEPRVILPRLPRGLTAIIRPRAENNIAVAAASIVASSRYLDRLERLSAEVGVRLAPGAGDAADRSVAECIRKHGADVLTKIVKLHFRNTGKITGQDLFDSRGDGD
ncbi:hypothetical protein JXA80_05500 [bacterium]|nr:hypothetical protein [candidate division CSSED10-310 bacterium]